MKKYTLIAVTFFTVFIAISNDSFATHAYGIELFYRHNPQFNTDSTYEFTMILNTVCCQGTCCGGYLTLRYKSDSLGIDSTFLVYRLPTTGSGVPPLQVDEVLSCTDSSGLCLEEYVFRGNWTSPVRARDWIFSYEFCCRGYSNNLPTYQNNLTTGFIHVECGLNNLDFPDKKSRNSSPIYHNRRPNHPGHLNDTIKNYSIKTLCKGINYTLDQSTREYQGDSVAYSFYLPQGQFGVPSTYNSPWSFTNPMPVLNGPLTINPITGVISITPGSAVSNGRFILGIQAEEYRMDTIVRGGSFTRVPKRIGFVKRELFIFIADSGNCRKDSLHPKDIHLDSMPSNNTLEVHFHNGDINRGNSKIKCSTISADGTEFRILDSSTYIAPYDTTVRSIAVLKATWTCYSGLTDEVTLTLAEPLKCGEYHLLLKKGTDLDVLQSECGFWEPEFSSSRIYTGDTIQLNLGPDKIFCDTLKFLYPFNAGGGYPKYVWNTGAITQRIFVDTFGIFIATVSNAFCSATDTVEIISKPCMDTTGNDTSYVNIERIIEEPVSIYPNPSSGIVHFSFENNVSCTQVDMYSATGKLVHKFDMMENMNRLDLSAYSNGLYLIQFIMKDGTSIQTKLLLQH